MKKYLIVVFSVLAVSPGSFAQDIHFSQFYENAILRNPALTGIFSGDYKAGVNYRTQWSNISVPFTTALVSAETRVATNKEVGDYLSFGVTSTYDQAGSIDFTSMQVYPAINYNKSMEDKHNTYLSVGFTAGFIQRSVDITKMSFSSQYVNGYNPANPSGENLNYTKVQNWDLGAGVSINSSAGPNNEANYYAGLAAYHVTQPNQSFQDNGQLIHLTTKWSGNLGFKYMVNTQYAVTFHINYTKQSPYEELIGGGMVSWKAIGQDAPNFTLYAGLFYRLNDAVIPTLKADYENCSLTLSYDINNSALKPATNGYGGYEISLYIRGTYKRTAKATDATRCPGFENLNNSFKDYRF
jgi:type IX secretion system PorP/SprF family membrane protein